MAPPSSFNNRQPFKPPGPASSKGSGSKRSKAVTTKASKDIAESSSADSESDLEIPPSRAKSLGGLVRRRTAASPAPSRPDAESLGNASEHGSSAEAISSSLPNIPPELVSRLVHDAFKNSETRITTEAMSVLCKYLELFVREAIFRSHHTSTQDDGSVGADNDDELLDVKDLEKLAPQLFLDF